VYSWQPATGLNNPNIANPIAAPTATTTYTLTGADDKNCFSDTKEVTINVYPIPAFNILDSLITLNLGSKDTLQTTSSPDVIRWEWSPPKWLDCINCAEPVIQPKGEITYTARASNEAGCSVADQVTIKMVCNGSNIFVPNTFSPNSDGMNDQFFPRANADISIRSLRIFNRWGQLIFEKINPQINNPVDGWDGKYQNNIMPEGVYVYFMEIICDKNGVFQLKGNTTLIR
jgi:gliding motility-associated-like protein